MLEYSQIRAILPQGHPMLLVDRVISLNPGSEIVGIKAITGNEPCYSNLAKDLGDERYAYPTSLLLESFGQTGAILWFQSTRSSNQERDGLLMFAAARNCVIEGRAFPGDVLRHCVRLDHSYGDSFFVEGETWVGDRRIATIASMIAVRRSCSSVLSGQ